MTISNQQLRDAYLSPQMECYFVRKMPDVSPAEVGVRIEEALKFLNIATYCHGSIPVTKEIDNIWHLWILETREYEKLCASLPGGTFIHHSSNVYAECSGDGAHAPTNDLEEDVAALGNYVLNYGPFEPERIRYWLLAAHLVDKCGLTVSQLNDWLRSGIPALSAVR
ncbi:MAG TPA: hypothetical protein VF063_04605 [Gaiellaceae bacterium]